MKHNQTVTIALPAEIAVTDVIIAERIQEALTADSPDTLIRNADTAMYRAETKGRTCYASSNARRSGGSGVTAWPAESQGQVFSRGGKKRPI